MKPDWKDAPEWASWMAMDENGWWYWYENEPIRDEEIWYDDKDGNAIPAQFDRWKEIKEKRPWHKRKWY